jgi:GTP-binding protein LepA
MLPSIIRPIGMREADIVKMDILLNNEKVDALSALIHRGRAQEFGRKLCEKLKSCCRANNFKLPYRLLLAPR